MDFVSIGVLLLVILTLVVAAMFVFLVWRNGYVRGWRVAREAPPHCPSCGYSLTGLNHCRCPECGKEYTLDDLWKAYKEQVPENRTSATGTDKARRNNRH